MSNSIGCGNNPRAVPKFQRCDGNSFEARGTGCIATEFASLPSSVTICRAAFAALYRLMLSQIPRVIEIAGLQVGFGGRDVGKGGLAECRRWYPLPQHPRSHG